MAERELNFPTPVDPGNTETSAIRIDPQDVQGRIAEIEAAKTNSPRVLKTPQYVDPDKRKAMKDSGYPDEVKIK